METDMLSKNRLNSLNTAEFREKTLAAIKNRDENNNIRDEYNLDTFQLDIDTGVYYN